MKTLSHFTSLLILVVSSLLCFKMLKAYFVLEIEINLFLYVFFILYNLYNNSAFILISLQAFYYFLTIKVYEDALATLGFSEN